MNSSLLLLTSEVLLSFFGSSSNGQFIASGWLWLGILAAFALGSFFYFRPRLKSFSVLTEEQSLIPALEVIQTTLYAGGHPEISEAIMPCLIYTSGGSIFIGKDASESGNECKALGSIPVTSLLDIRVEDVFTLKRKMTADRWVHSREYLQCLNNKKEEELAFVVIEWEKNNQHFITNLCIEGDRAMENALAKRNALYKKCRLELNNLN
ncbi:MAG: hypothetical protein IPH84_11700 [Bacteroidales bacterium]|nr:hypothetical protein [Bacteroidales bacterium]